MSKHDKQIEAITMAVKFAVNSLGIEVIRSSDFFGMKQEKDK